ncbi:MAG: hypothetical protein GX868_04710 [Actinobacteria bacterium]|nr:hypothetical protein [Actinomycetota bacterium]
MLSDQHVATTQVEEGGELTLSPGSYPAAVSSLLRRWVDTPQRRRITLVIGWCAAMLLAWLVRFAQDDAFISFRYAKNFANGHGLVFNPGERVEGYTNFLWTMLMVIPEKAGWSTPLFSQLLSMVAFGVTLWLVFRLASALLADDAQALLAVIVTVANATFLCYATGGLETMLVACWVMATLNLLVLPNRTGEESTARQIGDPTAAHELAAGVVAGLAVLTRMDTAVLIGSAWLLYVGIRWRRGDRALVLRAMRLGLPAAAIIGPWLIWKVSYYGSLVPNTMIAKEFDDRFAMISSAVVYLVAFVAFYGVVILADRFIFDRAMFVSTSTRRQTFALIPIWVVYVLWVGADFMEYRFMVSVIPILAVAVVLGLDRLGERWRQILAVVVMAALSFAHIATLRASGPTLPFATLRMWPVKPGSSFWTQGETLADMFPIDDPTSKDVVLSVQAVGIIPYLTDLTTIDPVGLTDDYVARNGEAAQKYYPAHTKAAPLEYLERRGVDLLSPGWYTVEDDPDRTEYRMSEALAIYPIVDLAGLPEFAHVVEVPIDADIEGTRRVWPFIYLQPDPAVDRVIEERGLRTFEITEECREEDVPGLTYSWGSRSCDFDW